MVESEVEILKKLNHPNIVNIIEYGKEGDIVKPNGTCYKGVVYIILEYVNGGLLFDVCQVMGGMGEQSARYFFKTMVGVPTYLER